MVDLHRGSPPVATAEPLPHELPANAGKYDLGRALARSLRRFEQRENGARVLALDGIEGEVSKEIERRSGRAPRGFFLPLNLPTPKSVQARALTTSTGAGALFTSVPRGELVDVLRANMVTGRLGARTIDVGAGSLSLPRKVSAGAPAWVPEGGSAPGTNFVADSLPLVPHSLIGNVSASRQYLRSTWEAGTDTIAEDLVASMAVAVDRASLQGTGMNGEPVGLLSRPDLITMPIGANGGPLTWANVCAIERGVGESNADAGAGAALGWATTPAVRSKLRQTEKVATSGNLVWTDANTVAGSPAYATSNMPSGIFKGTGTNLSALVYGNWSDLAIATWGAADVLINPYSAMPAVLVHCYLDVDVQARHIESFRAVLDVATN